MKDGKPLGEALNDIRQIESEIGLPEGVTSTFTGAGDLMAESFASIGFSMVLAVVLIYMVLAAQFESLVHPFTVMLSLPLSVVGALGLLFGLGLATTSRKFCVKTDPRLERVLSCLPGANCGACGKPGCMAFVQSLIAGKASPDSCRAIDQEHKQEHVY